MDDGKWTLSIDEELFNEHEYFDTRKECIEFGKEHFEGESFFIGQVKTYSPKITKYEVEKLIELLQEDAYELVGEVSDNFLTDVTDEQAERLGKIFTRVFKKVLKEDFMPNFFAVENIEEFVY